ncbi:ferric-uptake regulator [Lucifera butyrica]|uniref:Ferric-uptake regulator n=1 Tax=Lucifera butyrica TaxID=1351585 RepID=A0A498RBM2_9FIRM|nr:Fur family transcriptional regulator [Lucifera butyrica]VBB08365.1 ferric-uptake regulator [Lucifera butyrica]
MTEEIIQKLRERGCKITPQRRIVIQSLLKLDKFITAQEIYSDIKRDNPDVGLDTIYRNLNLLVGMGVVNQVNLPGKDIKLFKLALGEHHHHFVCLGCGEANCLNYCPVDEKGLQIEVGSEFQIVGHSFELYGYCRKCMTTPK